MSVTLEKKLTKREAKIKAYQEVIMKIHYALDSEDFIYNDPNVVGGMFDDDPNKLMIDKAVMDIAKALEKQLKALGGSLELE